MNWLKNKDIYAYVVRQARSCDYLEIYFDSLRPRLDKRGNLLLDKLLLCHRRQKMDIQNVIGTILSMKRNSFYFDNMKKGSDDLMTLLIIQYISYVRGKKRYELLKENNIDNSFRGIWVKFYDDASNNADITLNYLRITYGHSFIFKLWLLKIREYFLIRKINKFNQR
jgi:hypothetical protein